ncbi:MAG: cold shock domain-containing protein [Aquabacterium sp.]
MHCGKIKWFNALKGYGFISSPDTPADVFVHFSELQIEGFKTIRGNTRVTFDLLETDKGPIALKVQVRTDHEGAERPARADH